MITIVVIPADPTIPTHRRRLDPADLPAMERIVGGILHPVSLTDPESSLYLPEAGAGGRPLNPRALALAAFHTRPFQRQVLRGDAILTGPTQENGQDTDTPAELIRLLDAHTFRVQTKHPGDRRWSKEARVYPSLHQAYLHICKAVHHLPADNRPIIRVIDATRTAPARKGNQP